MVPSERTGMGLSIDNPNPSHFAAEVCFGELAKDKLHTESKPSKGCGSADWWIVRGGCDEVL